MCGGGVFQFNTIVAEKRGATSNISSKLVKYMYDHGVYGGITVNEKGEGQGKKQRFY